LKPAGWAAAITTWYLVSPVSRNIPSRRREPDRDAVERWESRALVNVNRKIRFVLGTIKHQRRGDKIRRAYVDRWDLSRRILIRSRT
jgi:hypothetical protein